ncbi:MAG: methyltransferase domain-containing protein [Desulfobacterales bacterium]|nr:methyltransferase domain-containing protein [Desulfobacterales bacterium]
MRWQTKAKIMKLCAQMPGGGALYRYIQKTFGRLRANPMARLPAQAKMVKWLLESGRDIVGKRFFEVGTGHVPIAPIGFFLCGAGSVITVDLHRRIEWGLTIESLNWIASNRNEVAGIYQDIVDAALFNERHALLSCHKNNPSEFFKEARIEYLAPMDAANTRLPAKSVDFHFSLTTLEHIPQAIIKDIFLEAKRILKPKGLAVHFIDLSDHFQHQDKSITSINFLRYSEKEWEKIAGNEFAYCNRLRASDYLALFKEAGFDICRHEVQEDEDVRVSIRDGFMVDERFQDYSVDDLCTTGLRVALKKNGKPTGI